uniref:Uncharacterized protein n=1 Tax=Anguilla anguilla TaxID=7936 RepID=A0A0E9QBX7_ANGAN
MFGRQLSWLNRMNQATCFMSFYENGEVDYEVDDNVQTIVLGLGLLMCSLMLPLFALHVVWQNVVMLLLKLYKSPSAVNELNLKNGTLVT